MTDNDRKNQFFIYFIGGVNMKRSVKILVGSLLIIFLSIGIGLAEEKATPEEAVQKVKEAVALIKEKGADAAYPIIRDQKGPFVWKDSYVVVTSSSGDMLVHPYNSKLEGKNVMGLKDANGKLFQAEMYNVTKTNGSGWVDYLWVKPGEKEPTQKVSFCMIVPGTNIECNAGVYGFTKDQVEKIVK